MTFLWGLLARSTEDATTIDEAISDAIDVHNEDPDAHGLADQALEVHRVSEVIDHLAESVVNDKIAIPSRYFNAIVDPADENAYDTVQGALDYCLDNGFGNIYITAGTHYVSADLIIDPRISLYGDGVGETIILPSTDATYELQIQNTTDATNENKYRTIVRDLTFGDSTHRFWADQLDLDINVSFINVDFAGIYDTVSWGVYDGQGTIIFDNCKFAFNSDCTGFRAFGATYTNCHITAEDNGSIGLSLFDTVVDNCVFIGSGSVSSVNWFSDADYSAMINNCRIYDCANTFAFGDFNNGEKQLTITNNFIQMASSSRLDLSTDKVFFANNRVTHASGNSVRFTTGTVKGVGLANSTTQAITDSGTTTQLSLNTTI